MSNESIIAEAEAIYLDASALITIAKEEENRSRTMRCLMYGSLIPIYSSLVGFGEFVACLGRKEVQKTMGINNYLFHIRSLISDFEMNKIRLSEPSKDKVIFLSDVKRIHRKAPSIGGGDIWHILSALELNRSDINPLFVSYDVEQVEIAVSQGLQSCNAEPLCTESLVKELESRGKYVAVGTAQ